MKKPRLLFLPGFLGQRGDWAEVIATLKSEFSCRALNSGEEPKPAPGDVLIGYSMGGRIALSTALRAKCRGLVLLSSSAGIESLAERRARRVKDKAWAKRIRSAAASDFLAAWYAQPVFAGMTRGARKHVMNFRRVGDRARWAERIERMSPGRVPASWAKLPKLKIPVLCVAGAKDVKYVGIARRMARLCPQGRLVIVPNASHLVHLDRPERLAAEIRKFVRESRT